MKGVYRLAMNLFICLVVILWVLIEKKRMDFNVYPTRRLLMALIGRGGLLTLYLWLMIRPFHKPLLPRWKRWRLVITAVTIVLLPQLLPNAHQAYPALLTGEGGDWASGMLALPALHLHCPIVYPFHIAMGHSSIMVGVWMMTAAKKRGSKLR